MPTPSLSTRACEAGMLCMPAVKHSVMGRITRGDGLSGSAAPPRGSGGHGAAYADSRGAVCAVVLAGVEGSLDTSQVV